MIELFLKDVYRLTVFDGVRGRGSISWIYVGEVPGFVTFTWMVLGERLWHTGKMGDVGDKFVIAVV